MINIIKEKVIKLIKTGFFSIFIANVFSKVIALFGGIVLVRFLSKEDYGIYSYAINAMTILYLLNDFGASTAALQYLTEAQNDKTKQQAILKYALKIGLLGSAFSGILIFLSPLFYPFKIEEARYLTPILCLEPLLTNVSYFISSLLRANQKNNRYAIVEFSKTFFCYFTLIIGAIFFGIIGAIISRYICNILTLIIGIICSKNLIDIKNKNNKLEKKEKKEFFNYSIITQLSNTIGGILLNIDIFLIGILIGTSTAVASYKVASTIPLALSFLPTCVTVYILPYFIRYKDDKSWVKTNYYKLIKYGSIVYGMISLVLIIFANLIFKIIYTDLYCDAVLPFRILIIGFFFSSTFKIPTWNIVASMRKVKVNLYISIFSVVSNFILNIVFIMFLGITGIAITTTLVNIMSSIILMLYVNRLLKRRKKI